MIHLNFDNIADLTAAHYDAVLDYVRSRPAPVQDTLFLDVKRVTKFTSATRNANDYTWLRNFILADVDTLEHWVTNNAPDLRFMFFKRLYLDRFAKRDEFVDNRNTYNAYTLFEMMGIKVCPYCDDETMDILHPAQGDRRTCDFDHFYPKGDNFYPALAMCFFNLIPSGKGCNGVMLTHPVAANPYHPDIENWSTFESNVPIGANLASLELHDFSISLRTSGKMTVNNATLDIEGRYNNRKEVIQRFLMASRYFEDEKIDELQRLGLPRDEILIMKELALGRPYPMDRGKVPYQKLRHDLTGY